MAEGFPLVLFDCAFDQPVWQSDAATLRQNGMELERIWTEHAVKAAMIGDMIASVKERLRELPNGGGQESDPDSLLQALFPERKGREYQPLKGRKTCDTIESRLSKRMKV